MVQMLITLKNQDPTVGMMGTHLLHCMKPYIVILSKDKKIMWTFCKYFWKQVLMLNFKPNEEIGIIALFFHYLAIYLIKLFPSKKKNKF